MVGGEDGRGLRSVRRQGLVGVKVFMVVMVDVCYSQFSQSAQTEGGVAQTCSEHIHRPRELQKANSKFHEIKKVSRVNTKKIDPI